MRKVNELAIGERWRKVMLGRDVSVKRPCVSNHFFDWQWFRVCWVKNTFGRINDASLRDMFFCNKKHLIPILFRHISVNPQGNSFLSDFFYCNQVREK